MALSKLRQHHLLTGALPPRDDAECDFLISQGRCEVCLQLPPDDGACGREDCPPTVAAREAPAEIPPFLAATEAPPESMRDHTVMPLAGGTPISGSDPTPDPPPPPRAA